MANLQALHLGVFPIHVLQDVGMDQEVIETRIENGTLILGATLNLDPGKILVPHLAGSRTHLVEVKTGLLRLHVLASILDADIGDTHLHRDRLILLCRIVKPDTHIIATHLTGITTVDLIFTCIGIPSSLSRHGALLLPVAPFRRSLA